MKKALSIALSFLMILTCCISAFAAEKTITAPASAYAGYDKSAVAQKDAEYIASLSYDQIAGLLLDWLDRQVAAAAEDFNNFEIEVMGQTVSADIDVQGIDDLLAYKDYVAQLGGDFANLDTSAFVTRDGGDVNFLYGVFQFMADNAETLGKVFGWTEDAVFDYGNVGAYIEGLEDGNEIKTFYENYLVGGDIQEKFVNEIAGEMNYTPAEGETFDQIIDNGVTEWFIGLVGEALSDESVAAIRAYDLRDTDVYTLVKNFFGLVQNDYKGKLDEILEGFLKALQGAMGVITDAINIEPPTLTISDANTVIGTYQPNSTDFESYMPKIYSPYKEQLKETDYYDMIAGEAIPEELASVITGTGVDMADKFVFNVAPVPEQLAGEFTFPIEISFSDIESFANSAIAEMLPDIQATVDQVVAQAISAGNSAASILGITLDGSVKINSITVSLSYKGYSTDDAFVCEVTAIPDYYITYSGNVWDYAKIVGLTTDKIESDYIQPAIAEVLKNPAATVVVENLASTEDSDLADIIALANFIDTEAAYDTTLLDFAANYDEYKGFVGQINRVLCGALKNALTDEAYADLGLVEGGNENLDANIAKLCAKVDGLMAAFKKYVDRDTFISLADTANIGAGFASSHGFNAGMIYDMDFSNPENALVCAIRLGCDLLVNDDPDSILYDFHMRVEDLDTLDAMAAAVIDMALEKVIASVDPDYAYAPIDYAKVAEDGARDAVYAKADDIIFDFADVILDKGNALANDIIASFNEKLGTKIGSVEFKLGVEKTGDWQTDFEALADRFIALTDGLCILSGTAKDKTGFWAKATELSYLIPIESMFSNYEGLEALDSDFFGDALDGKMGALLSHFEVKEDAVAGDVSVTKALINASDYIVDKFFPDTVQSELYPESLTVQDTFTGSLSDTGIAARNMVSINARRSHILPALLDLVRESGILPSLACDHAHTEEVAEVKATCHTKGTAAGVKCADCGVVISGCEELAIDPANHEGPVTDIAAVEPTCTKTGSTAGTKCSACGKTITAPETIPALGHDFVDGKCTRCDAADPTATSDDDNGGSGNIFTDFFARIRSFFQRIADFFRNLFKR